MGYILYLTFQDLLYLCLVISPEAKGGGWGVVTEKNQQGIHLVEGHFSLLRQTRVNILRQGLDSSFLLSKRLSTV